MSSLVSGNGAAGGRAPPPAVKPRPKGNGAVTVDKPKVAPPPVKKKPPVAAPPSAAAASQGHAPVPAPANAAPSMTRHTPPSAHSPDPQASPSRKPRPPPPTRHQSLAFADESKPPPQAATRPAVSPVSVKKAAEMVIADSYHPPPPPPSSVVSTQPEAEELPPPPAVMIEEPLPPPPPSMETTPAHSTQESPRARAGTGPSVQSPPGIAPRPRNRSQTFTTNAPPPATVASSVATEPISLPPLEPMPIRKPSIDLEKYDEIESMISGLMLDLDDRDFFTKALEEYSDDVSTV
ncbi:uncharacterized protein LOC135811443 isoform X2 [Sycon ciliatum]|uniref:uncharacterized protein LOC135811443 isoform X2 n=1 Tax=Sycon ciliatum TaxID=27933 RepID=UPI0031F6F397